MSPFLSKPCTAFAGFRRIAGGPLIDVALEVHALLKREPSAQVLVFGDTTGGVIDLDLRGTTAEIVARLTARAEQEKAPRATTAPEGEGEDGAARGRGRPKLGVVAREVTLLPRHWDWLATQPGGASQALRRLIDEARKADGGRTARRATQEVTYRFMSAMAGNLPGFEEATRALFAGDAERFAWQVASWPADIRAHVHKLAKGDAG